MNTEFIDNIEQFVLEIPKVELHLHLEGAIPLETLFDFIQKRGGEPSIKNLDDLRRKLNYTEFAHFIDLWVWKNTFIKEEKDFEEIAYQVLCNLSKQNVKYVEAHYAPGDYWRQGLSEQGITECLIKGKKRAHDDFGIGCELILDICRDNGPEKGMERLNMLKPYLGKGLIGIGLGGSEQIYPADPYADVYEEARERGFRLTAHAGEAAGPESIWAAIEKLGVERIGHGTRANEDPQLVSLLKQRQIPLEICVISNVRTGVCGSIEAHPIKKYFKQGLMVTVNSDDPVMFNTTISQEYLVLVKKLGFTINDLKRLSMNGIKASFMSDKDKQLMEDQFEKEWKQLMSKYL
ncbi:MAG: adenosine deaminase [bacterium]